MDRKYRRKSVKSELPLNAIVEKNIWNHEHGVCVGKQYGKKKIFNIKDTLTVMIGFVWNAIINILFSESLNRITERKRVRRNGS